MEQCWNASMVFGAEWVAALLSQICLYFDSCQNVRLCDNHIVLLYARLETSFLGTRGFKLIHGTWLSFDLWRPCPFEVCTSCKYTEEEELTASTLVPAKSTAAVRQRLAFLRGPSPPER